MIRKILLLILFPMLASSLLIDDPSEPFDYFAYPTTAIGVKDSKYAFEVTPEGYIFSGRAEMAFLWGPNIQPLERKVKTLYKGYLPIVQYSLSQDNCLLSFQLFAYNPFLDQDNPLAFAEVSILNKGNKKSQNIFWIGIRFMGPGHRVAKEDFFPAISYTYSGGKVFRNGKLLCIVPLADIVQQKEAKNPSDFGLLLGYNLSLAPGEEKRLVFQMFNLPVEPAIGEEFLKGSTLASRVREQVIEFWEGLLRRGSWLDVPEKKVVDTYRSNLVYLFLARSKEGEDYIQKVNKFQYDAFWLRDGAFMVRAMDVWGYPWEAEKSLYHFLKYQRENGLFLSQEGQLDGWGQAVWTLGQHYLLTKDLIYAKKVYPAIKKAMEWLIKTREETKKSEGIGKGLLPATHPYDNENVYGHIIGNDFWAYRGVKVAVEMARALGFKEDAERFTQELEDYRNSIIQNLEIATKSTGGYIPPALEGGGFDWGNLKAVYCEVLDPWDEKVTATLKKVRQENFNEGLMTYASLDNLHGYIGIDVPQTELVRGEKKQVLDAFYSLLLHTTSTNAGFEMCSASSRDFGLNLTPHGCFAGKFLELLRNMIIREEGDELHIFSCLPPAWLIPGKRLSFLRFPTYFGNVSLSLYVMPKGGKLHIRASWLNPPSKIIIHAPPGYTFPQGERIEVPADTQFIDFLWNKEEEIGINYESKVREYLAQRKKEEEKKAMEYKRKIEEAKAKDKGNLALGKQVSASSFEPGSFPQNAVDGDDSTYWGASPYPQWLMVDLGKPERVSRIMVKTFWDGSRYYHYEVEVSRDGTQWIKVGEKKDDRVARSEGEVYRIPPESESGLVRFIRVRMLYNSANIGVHIVELKCYRD